MNTTLLAQAGRIGDGLWLARGWPGVLIVALIAASIVGSVYLYRRQRVISLGWRLGLGTLRAAVLILLLAILLQPTISVTETTQSRKKVLVLIDSSPSMSVQDTRKADDDIAEAALAMGALPFETALAQQQMALGKSAMRQAQRHLDAGRRDAALEAQQAAMDAINSAAAELGKADSTDAARAGQWVMELKRIADHQGQLRQQLAALTQGSDQWAMFASQQMILIDELTTLARGVIASPHRLTARQREALATTARIDLVKSVLSNTYRNVIDSMGPSYDAHYYHFAEALSKIGRSGADARAGVASLTTQGEGTHLADAIAQAVGGHTGPVAGVVVFTDGAATDGDAIEVARRMGERGVPIYPVAIGLPEPDDVSIESVIVQEVAFEGDTVPVHVQIHSRGYERRQTYLSAYLNDRRVAHEPVLLTGAPQFKDVFFDVTGASTGSMQIKIGIEAFAGEATDRNNIVSRSLRVIDEKINVLYLEGSARWEFRYLRAILLRDPRLNVKFISTLADAELARTSRDYLERFPEDLETAFSFDLVILGDVDPAFFRGDELARLEQLVRERGGSFLMLAGRRYAPTRYADSPIQAMLPVYFEAGAPWDEIGDDVHPVVTPAGRHSMVMTLADSARRNDVLWARIKPLGHIPPVTQAKPGAVVLAELSDIGPRGNRTPVIAWQRYGTGKSMFISTDRLWRLRFKTGDKYHWRLWSQTIQFLTLSRLLGENRRVILETDRKLYRRGERVRVLANVLDEGFSPVLSPSYHVTLAPASVQGNGKARTVALKPEPGRPGLYSGYVVPEEEGRYQVLAETDHQPFANTAEFHVSVLQREMKVTDMQLDELERIATVSGGQVLSIRQLPALPALLDQRTHQVTYVRQVSLWDKWPVLAAFVLLTGVEWYLRRRNDLA
ncbi:MAG: VWA domain-containing protein [Phycisphaeraceae bacterium]